MGRLLYGRLLKGRNLTVRVVLMFFLKQQRQAVKQHRSNFPGKQTKNCHFTSKLPSGKQFSKSVDNQDSYYLLDKLSSGRNACLFLPVIKSIDTGSNGTEGKAKCQYLKRSGGASFPQKLFCYKGSQKN